MVEPTPLRPEDVLPVRSRISWGAIFAGVFSALFIMVLLTLLGTALGLTWSEYGNGSENLASGAAIWAAITGLLSLFVGGLVTSLFTAGESRGEAVLYGIVLWGLMFACVSGISFAGARFAVSGVLGTASVMTGTAGGDWEQAARDAGISQDQINQMRARMPAVVHGDVRVNRDTAMRAAWWSLLGAVLSMIAAICGTLAGCGPTPYLRGLLVRRTVVTTTPGSTLPPQ